VNVNIRANNFAGGIAGECSGTIESCRVSGTVTANSYAGGIAGVQAARANNIITNCAVTAAVNSNGNYAGGITGQSNGTIVGIEKCYTSGTVIAAGNNAGGITGYSSCNVSNCYSTGNITGRNFVGGISGIADNDVQLCYATGTVSGQDCVGGITGSCARFLMYCVALNSAVTRSSGSLLTFGRIDGNRISGGYTNNYARSALTVVSGATGHNGTSVDPGTSGTTNPPQYNSTTFWSTTMGFNLGTIWQFSSGLPTLRNMP